MMLLLAATAAGEKRPRPKRPAAEQAAEPQDEANRASSATATPTFGKRASCGYYVTETDLAGDIHWQKGLRCPDCHGGDPTTADVDEAHAARSRLHS